MFEVALKNIMDGHMDGWTNGTASVILLDSYVDIITMCISLYVFVLSIRLIIPLIVTVAFYLISYHLVKFQLILNIKS